LEIKVGADIGGLLPNYHRCLCFLTGLHRRCAAMRREG